MQRLRSKLTYANVTATLALFLTLAGGTAYAATHLGKESVGPKQLKMGAVTPAKLSKAVSAKLNRATPVLAVGPAGPRGDPGPKGDPGSPGLNKVITIQGDVETISTGAEGGGAAECPAGDRAVSGGWAFVPPLPEPGNKLEITEDRAAKARHGELFTMFPQPNSGEEPDSWFVALWNESGKDIKLRASVQCAVPAT